MSKATLSLSKRQTLRFSRSQTATDPRTSSTQLERVLLVNADTAGISELKRVLKDLGYAIVDVLQTNDNLIEATINNAPDVVIVGIDLPNEFILNRIAELQQVRPCPVVMFAERDAPEITQQVIKAGVNGYVAADVQASKIPRIITLAIARFEDKRQLQQELESTKNKLAARKVIDRAKGLLMTHQNMSEDEAYKKLQKLAMDKGIALDKAAQNIIDILNLLQ